MPSNAKKAAPKKAAPKKAAPKKAAPKKAAPKKAKAVASDAPEGTMHVFPTHRRGPEDLIVSDPSGESIVVTDEGADLPEAVAQQLIDFREATTEPPQSEK